MQSTVAVGLVSIAATYLFLRALLHLTQDAKEPPVVGKTLPFVGPLIAMARGKSRFHSQMRDKHGLPIYTLRLPGTRMYIVNSAALIPAVQRLYRTVSFAAIEAQAATYIMSLSKSADAVVSRGLMDDDSYTGSFASAIHPAVSPGANLDAMNRASVRSISASLDRLQAAGGKNSVELFRFMQHEIVMATTDAVYGPHNPFRDPDIEEAWYQFEPKMMMFALNLVPRFSARAAFQARQRIFDAFVKYFEAGHHEEGSALIKCRYEYSEGFGFSIDDIARCEVGGLFAILGSTIPTSFWLIYHVYSDPAALQDCRRELERLVETGEDGCSSTIDITSVKTKCPVLLSTLQEVLRFRHIGVSARVVLQEEHLLGDKYRLKKGSILMIPTPVYHSDPVVWGSTVAEFDHRRFAPEESGDGSDKHNGSVKPNRKGPIARASYRPFGGGHVLCPGRHFATTEILAFAALAVLRFDIEPTTTGHMWPPQTIENSPLVAALPVPDNPILVNIRPRAPHRKWRVELEVSEKPIGIAAEDLAD